MTTHRFLTSLLLAALLACTAQPAASAGTDSELQRLREENALLRRQIEDARQQCTAGSKPAAIPPSSGVPALPAAIPDASASTAVPQSARAAPDVPPGYKLVKIEPKAPYSETGCRQYKGAVDTRWKRRDNWDGLVKGQTMAEVEELLGIEHFNINDRDRIGWQYGKCEASVKGLVVFEAGKVLFWNPPPF